MYKKLMSSIALFFTSISLGFSAPSVKLVAGSCSQTSVMWLQSTSIGAWQVAPSSPAISPKAQVHNITCDGKMNCIAVSTDTVPTVSISNDNGTSWTTSSISGFPKAQDSQITSLYCGDYFNNPPICIASGVYKDGSWHPLVLTNNASQGWQARTFPDIASPSNGDSTNAYPTPPQNNINCNDDTCLIVGNFGSAIYTDNYSFWHEIPYPVSASSNFYIYSSSCINQKLCVVVGTNNNVPILFTTPDAGKTWSQVTSGIPTAGTLNYVDCQGDSCTAVGNSAQGPFVLQSTDAKTWTPVALPLPGSKSYQYMQANCGKTNCVIAGSVYKSIGNSELVVFSSADHGKTWQVSPVANLPNVNGQYQLSDSFCDDTGCIVVGMFGGKVNNIFGPPILAYSQNGAWSLATITGLPTQASACNLTAISRPFASE